MASADGGAGERVACWFKTTYSFSCWSSVSHLYCSMLLTTTMASFSSTTKQGACYKHRKTGFACKVLVTNTEKVSLDWLKRNSLVANGNDSAGRWFLFPFFPLSFKNKNPPTPPKPTNHISSFFPSSRWDFACLTLPRLGTSHDSTNPRVTLNISMCLRFGMNV